MQNLLSLHIDISAYFYALRHRLKDFDTDYLVLHID